MKFFHTRFSQVFFIIYAIISVVFILQDITADRSFFDLSGFGLYLLAYPFITLLKLFINLNTDSKLILYLIFFVSTVFYYYIIDFGSLWVKKNLLNKF